MSRVVVLLAVLLPTLPVHAATFSIWSDTGNTWDCTTSRTPDGGGAAVPVQPGDTVYLRSRTAANAGNDTIENKRVLRLWPTNCVAPGDGASTPSAPHDNPEDWITFSNHPSDRFPVTFASTSQTGSTALKFVASEGIWVNGTVDWVGKDSEAYCGAPAGTGCGIVMAPTDNVTYVMSTQISGAVAEADKQWCTPDGTGATCYPGIRHFYIEGMGFDFGVMYDPTPSVNGGIGIYTHDAGACGVGRAGCPSNTVDYPFAWREDVTITGNWFSWMIGEGVYAGNNGPSDDSPDGCADLVTGSGTAQAGGASSITLAGGASAVDDYHVMSVAYITAGTGSGQSREILDYNGTTKVATVSSAWATQPNATSVYSIHGACIPNRNIRINDNYGTDFGRDPVNVKWTLEGSNEINGNHFYRSGLHAEAAQTQCINVYEGPFEAVGNVLFDCGGTGVSSFNGYNFGAGTTHEVTIANNLIVRAGLTADTAARRSAIRATSNSADVTPVVPEIYSNTVVAPVGDPVVLERTVDAVVENNIFAKATACDTACIDETSTTNTTADFNITVSIAGVGFVDAGLDDYRLASEDSPAVDAATATPFSLVDILGVSRPQGDEADAGAYEFVFPAAIVRNPVRKAGIRR